MIQLSKEADIDGQRLLQLDKAHIWHPYTQMKTAGPARLICRGQGALLFDENDQAYIDAVSSWWVTIHGHAHPYLAKKIYEQLGTLEHVIFAGFTHQPAIDLAHRLLKHLPENQNRLFFSDNGSTAVEVGLKMAIQYFYNRGNRGRRKIIAFEHAYHGDTFGAMSAGGASVFNAPFEEMLFEVIHLPVPVKGREQEVLSKLEQALASGEVCAFVFEPLVLGAGGMMMYEADVLDRMIALCREKGSLCIADEVMTGFGRTGRLFASNYLEHKPDIICLSKGLTGGVLPMALTTCTEAIYEAFLSEDATKTFFHGHSFTGNPIGCAAALASLDLLERPEFSKRIAFIEQEHQAFAATLADHPMIADLRQRGTILALELQTGQQTSYLNNIRSFLSNFFYERHIILRPLGNVLYIMPPYVIEVEQLHEVYGAVREALAILKEKAGL
ncbi:MAG: adenosylmethionine--8-amino-7-oxononanoate transaminase [Bacteroidota bacterium]